MSTSLLILLDHVPRAFVTIHTSSLCDHPISSRANVMLLFLSLYSQYTNFIPSSHLLVLFDTILLPSVYLFLLQPHPSPPFVLNCSACPLACNTECLNRMQLLPAIRGLPSMTQCLFQMQNHNIHSLINMSLIISPGSFMSIQMIPTLDLKCNLDQKESVSNNNIMQFMMDRHYCSLENRVPLVGLPSSEEILTCLCPNGNSCNIARPTTDVSCCCWPLFPY